MVAPAHRGRPVGAREQAGDLIAVERTGQRRCRASPPPGAPRPPARAPRPRGAGSGAARAARSRAASPTRCPGSGTRAATKPRHVRAVERPRARPRRPDVHEEQPRGRQVPRHRGGPQAPLAHEEVAVSGEQSLDRCLRQHGRRTSARPPSPRRWSSSGARPRSVRRPVGATRRRASQEPRRLARSSGPSGPARRAPASRSGWASRRTWLHADSSVYPAPAQLGANPVAYPASGPLTRAATAFLVTIVRLPSGAGRLHREASVRGRAYAASDPALPARGSHRVGITTVSA